MHLLPALISLSVGATAAAAAVPPDALVSVRLQPDHCRLGDPIELEIVLREPEGTRYGLPKALPLGEFQELDRAREESTDRGRRRVVHRLRVALYELGKHELPPIRFTAGDGGPGPETPPFTVTVEGMLEASADGGFSPADIVGPVDVTVRDYTPAYAAAGVVLLGLAIAAAVLAARRRRGGVKAGPPPEPPRPAHEVALEALRAILNEDLISKGRHKEYYFRAADAVRSYLGARYGFDSLEMTTTELLAAVRSRRTPGLSYPMLEAFCRHSDPVKFSTYRPTPAECKGLIDQAFSMVEDTRPAEGAMGGAAT